MENRMFFDSNVFVGKVGYKHRLQKWQTEEIVDELERNGIAGALVYHGMAKAHSPAYGNRQLLMGLNKSERLFGCWVALPEHVGDFMSPQEMIHDMKQNQIRAVKIFPKHHQYDPNQRTMKPLFSALEREQIPLLVDASEITFDQLADVLFHHPDLTVLLQNLGWSQERRLFPLMDQFEKLCIEFSALQSNAIIEICYERYGAERLFYGSGMPMKSPGAARTFIDYAQIPEEAKNKIAGGNLARLLGIQLDPVSIPEQDEITSRVSRGLPIEIPVYDSHTHLIEDGGGTGSGFPMLKGDIDSMISLYQALGVRKMSIAPWVGINGGDAEAGNRVAEQAIQKYPDKVEGYAVIDPNYTEDVEREARIWHLDKGFKGMKPYYYLSHIPYTDPVYEPWWKLGNEKHLYALVDPAGQSDAAYTAQIDELASRYPNVAIFMDHAARSFEIAELYAEVAKKHQNVFLQLTYTTVPLGSIEYLTREAGVEKILFGTDSPMRDPRPQVGWLAFADLSINEKKAIFGGNMKKIWERCLV